MTDPASPRTRPSTWLVITAIAFFLLLLWFAVRMWRSADRTPSIDQTVAATFEEPVPAAR
jgi:hypothetical protein